jgi:Protein of unknown function (DUF3604)
MARPLLTVALLVAGACSPSAGEPAKPAPDAAGVPREWTPGSDDLAPPSARMDLARSLREALDAPRHASDGGGHATLLLPDGDDGSVTAGASRAWTLRYEAGPLGVADGGTVFFQPPPFWGWSTPQVEARDAPGFTTVEGPANLELDVFTADQWLLAIGIQGRALQAGETLTLVYGAGPAGARADRFRDAESLLRFAVDGDGDGVREIVPDPPSVAVHAGPAARLVLSADSSARPGASARLTLAVLDAVANDGTDFTGEIALEYDAGLTGPATVTLAPGDGGCAEVAITAQQPGIGRVRAQAPGLPAAESNPLQVAAEARRILWADLHGHSGLSDGTGSPEDWWRYARRTAGLDVAALTDHDHWGVPFLDAAPELWSRLTDCARNAHEEGRFVALPAYEWTSWIHGHRHVLSFEDTLELRSCLDPRWETPAQLRDALAGRAALIFAHHTAGGPIANNWSFAPDPVLEPVTEIMSVHGSSEAEDSPRRIYDFRPGYTARDALDAGYRLGFVGSGDTHDGHPGLGQLTEPDGHAGLAAVLSEDCTRAGVLEALRARHCYATSGPRILLRASLGGLPMGSDVPPGTHALAVLVAGTGALARLELVRSGAVVDRVSADGAREADLVWTVADLRAGEYVYVRVVQADDHLAWTSPFFVRAQTP